MPGSANTGRIRTTMILFLYGSDSFRSRSQMNKMIAKFQADRDPSRLNVVVPDIKKDDPGKILEELHVSPFLAEKRMVVLKGVLASKEKKLQEMLLEKLKSGTVPDFTILLIYEEVAEFGKVTNVVKELFALLQKEKYAQQFDILTGARLSQFIEEQTHEKQGSIEPKAVQYLCQNSKDDIWLVETTIDQLVAYADGRTITLEDVKKFIPERFDDNIFNLVDAIVAGDGGRVFQQLQEQYKKGEDAMFVFSMLLRQFRILLQIRDMLDRNGGMLPEGAGKELGLHPFVLKKSLPSAKKFSFPALKDIYSSLLEFDRKMKTGGGEAEVLLDMFIAKLCVK